MAVGSQFDELKEESNGRGNNVAGEMFSVSPVLSISSETDPAPNTSNPTGAAKMEPTDRILAQSTPPSVVAAAAAEPAKGPASFPFSGSTISSSYGSNLFSLPPR